MKRVLMFLIVVVATATLSGHMAYNSKEQQGIKGKVRARYKTPMLGDPGSLELIDEEGKTTLKASFGHMNGWDRTISLDEFIRRELDNPTTGTSANEDGYFEREVVRFEYLYENGKITKCLTKDSRGLITQLNEYFYEGDVLVKSVDRPHHTYVTYWNAEGGIIREFQYDEQGELVWDSELMGNDKEGAWDPPTREEHDFYGNVTTLFFIENGHEYEACLYDYLYYSPVSSVSASSSPAKYKVQNLLDGDIRTTWVANSNPDGINDWVMLQLDGDSYVISLDIAPGFACVKDGKDLFLLNNSLKKITLTLSGGRQIEAKFNGRDRKVSIPVNDVTGSIKISIDEVYPGSKWRDMCIADLSVNVR